MGFWPLGPASAADHTSSITRLKNKSAKPQLVKINSQWWNSPSRYWKLNRTSINKEILKRLTNIVPSRKKSRVRLTNDQSGGKAEGTEERPEGVMALQGFEGQTLGSVVLGLAAWPAFRGPGGQVAEVHLGWKQKIGASRKSTQSFEPSCSSQRCFSDWRALLVTFYFLVTRLNLFRELKLLNKIIATNLRPKNSFF